MDEEYVLVARPQPVPPAQPSPALSADALAAAKSRSAAVLQGAASDASRGNDAAAAVALLMLALACQPSPETAIQGGAAVEAARASGLAGHAHLPCRWRCTHAAAAGFARAGGAAELRGAATEALASYDKALTLLGLILASPITLAPAARIRLTAAAAALRGRVNASAAAAEMEAPPAVWWPPSTV
jgi:hypothetical protein